MWCTQLQARRVGRILQMLMFLLLPGTYVCETAAPGLCERAWIASQTVRAVRAVRASSAVPWRDSLGQGQPGAANGPANTGVWFCV